MEGDKGSGKHIRPFNYLRALISSLKIHEEISPKPWYRDSRTSYWLEQYTSINSRDGDVICEANISKPKEGYLFLDRVVPGN